MESEAYTFVVCSHVGHSVESRYFNRHDADKHFNELVRQMHTSPEGLHVAYYCASVGGLVNAATAV